MSHCDGPNQSHTRHCYSIAEYVTPNDNTGYYDNAQQSLIDCLYYENQMLTNRIGELKQQIAILSEMQQELFSKLSVN